MVWEESSFPCAAPQQHQVAGDASWTSVPLATLVVLNNNPPACQAASVYWQYDTL